MKPSIRTFLLINLLLSVSLIISLAIIGNLFLEHKDLRGHLDAQLSMVALTILAFAKYDDPTVNLKDMQRRINAIPGLSEYYYFEEHHNTKNPVYEKIQFQIWSRDRQLLLRSKQAPREDLSDGTTGFSDKWINGEPWRIFTRYDVTTGLTIDVAERYDFREELEGRITKDSIFIMLITYPFLGLLIWLIVGRGLDTLTKVTEEVRHRAPTYLEPVNLEAVPKEIKPLIVELNHLFQRLQNAFEREKRFAADAAHELRTPLAALKTQLQVALKAGDSTRNESLKKIIRGVDRSTHVVEQLLTISRMVPEATLKDQATFRLAKLATDVIAEIAPQAVDKDTEIELEAPARGTYINGSETAIAILLRNLIDNSIRYTPEGSLIKVTISETKDSVILSVADNGPGIPMKLRARVLERFFRVLGNKTTGSGLGLGIVQQIVELHQATMTLGTPEWSKGLEVIITFPKAHKTS